MKQCVLLFILILFVWNANAQNERSAVSDGVVTINGKEIKYKAAVREFFIPSKDSAIASVIATSYEQENTDTLNRPVLFLFNGGPGASSSPLHLHAFGPVRLHKEPDTTKQINNPYSLLDAADLVFIDPIGTGFTKIFDQQKAEDYMDVVADAKCIVHVIKLWQQEHHRSSSPFFICGESYGTIRAVKTLGVQEHSPAKGVLLFSADLNVSMMASVGENDMPFLLNLPSMAAIAWYHGKIEKRGRTVQQIFNEAIDFANTTYLHALFKGNLITPEELGAVADKLSKIYGLPATTISAKKLRVSSEDFEMLLMENEHMRIGKLNGQIATLLPKEQKPYNAKEDPSLVVNTNLQKDFAGKYFTGTLKFPAEGLYRGINFDVNARWKWNSMDAYLGYFSVVPDLETAMKNNQHLKLLIAGGMYDLATPLYATEYLLNHSEVPKDRTTFLSFPSGHSIFDNEEQLPKLSEAVKKFILAN